MKLINYQRLGRNNGTPRLWIESGRLSRLGFDSGTSFTLRHQDNGIALIPDKLGRQHVSSRQVSLGRRPIIDICSKEKLGTLENFDEIRVSASFEQILLFPSHRAVLLNRRRKPEVPFRTVEYCVGGGTLSQAFASNPKFKLILGLEIEPNYSDVWERAHPQAELWSADMRLVHPTEVPEHDVFIAGIPCDDHSNMGRAKKKLAGKPESGEKGDLFLSITSLISHHMPNAVVVENVVSYGSSMAGTSLRVHLERMGYQCVEHILDPNAQWDEPSDRKRWILIALLKEGFALHVPNTPFAGQACDYLDPANPEQDEREARHIAATIVGLRAHNKRHAAQGHGFAMTCLNGNETKIPTIPKSYHKINTGPFVNTPFGPRMLRKHEIERIMGATIDTPHYATAVQILGQGVQTRIFRDIFQQLGDFLDGTTPPAESQPLMVAPLTVPTVQSFIPAAPAGQLALL